MEIQFVDEPKPQSRGLTINFEDQPAPAAPSQGVGQAFLAGLQGSSGGLAVRGKLPSIELDPQNSSWYERLSHSAGGFVGDIPAGLVGLVGGATAGSAVAPVAGTVVGAGAGAMALPAAIREAYMQAYTKGEIQNAGDFLDRTGVVLASTGKAAVIGGVTGGVGKVAGIGANALKLGAVSKAVTSTTLEAGAATVTSAALEGHLPHLQDFADNALFIAGMKGAVATPSAVKAVSNKLATIYRQTGKTPLEVMADASKDPSIIEDLNKGGESNGLAVNSGTNANGVFYSTTTEGVGTHEYSSSPTGVYGRFKGEGGSESRSVLNAEGEFVQASEIVRNADNADPATTAFKGAPPVMDFIAQLAAAAKDLNISDTLAAKYEALIKRLARGEVTLEEAKAEVAEAAPKAVDPLAEYGPTIQSSGLPEAYRELAATNMAMEAMPTDKLQKVIDKPFADIPDAKLPEGLNLKYVENFDQLASFDARITEVFKDEINAQRGGTQGWAETVAKGEALLRTAAGEEAVNLLRREAGTADTAHVLHARGMMMFKALSDAKEAATAYENAPAELKPQLMAEALQAANKAAAFKSYFTGAAAEAGRALQFLQYMKDARAQADVMGKMLDAYNGKSPDALLRALSNADSMSEMGKMIDAVNKPDLFDKYMDYRRSSLMSGYLTIARNTFGGTLMLGKNVLTDAYAALSSRLTPGADTVPFSQAMGRLTGYTFAAGTMFKEAARTFREAENVKQGIKDVSTAAWEGAVEATGGIKPLALSAEGNLIERAAYYQAKGVFGANTLIDGMMRNFGYYGEMYSRASKDAIEAGLSVGSKQFMDFVQERVSNPSAKDIAAAEKTAAEVVFSGETGPLLQKVYNTLNDWKYAKVVVPFVGVPGKMLEAGSRLSPFAPLVKSWREDVAAGGERAQRAHAEAAIGRVMWATTANLYRDDMITGYGPPEPEKRAVWLSKGQHQPYSVKIGGQWYNYGQTLQPIGPMLGMVADIMQLYDFMDAEEQDRIPKAAFLTFKNVIGNATMLQGAADFFSIFTDEGSMVKFMRNFATSNLPAAGLMGNVAQGIDPYQREVNSMLDAVKARIPGVRETLQPKRDVLGDAIPEPDKLAMGIIPAKSVAIEDSKVAAEAARLSIGVGKIPDHIELPAGKDKRLGKVELTPEEKDIWAREAGQMANAILQGSVTAPDWDTLPDQTQRIIMQSAFERSREYGRKMALSPERLDAEYQRIGKGIERNFGQKK